MRTQAEIEARLAEVLADERLNYPPADTDTNAALALTQVLLESWRNALRWVLHEDAARKETADGPL